MRILRRFRQEKSGQFGILFGLLLVPVAAAAGLAVDYTKASNIRFQMKHEADKIALAVAANGVNADDAALLDGFRSNLSDRFAFRGDLADVVLDGEWVSISDFQVTAALTMRTSIGSILQTGPVSIGATSTARYKGAAYVYTAPKVAQLDPEAWDYNRVSVYCFDARKAADAKANAGGGRGGSSANGDKAPGRSQMTPIADNNGGHYNVEMPVCGAGEALSLKLWNVREAKHYGDDPDKSTRRQYTYYTDTVIENGVESYDLGELRLVETVLCDTFEQCKPKSRGGVIPEGKNRNPQISTATCAPGKFRYYGFEDRPPENGGSDRDYDDIRVIIECPVEVLVGPETVRLVQ
jgi:hypothetical protein